MTFAHMEGHRNPGPAAALPSINTVRTNTRMRSLSLLVFGATLAFLPCTSDAYGQDQGRFFRWASGRKLDRAAGYAMGSGNYLLAGNQMLPDGVVAMMCDPQGSPLWLRTWVGPSFSAYSPGEFNNGDPYIVWWDYVWNASSLHAVRFDPAGTILWQRSYPLGSSYFTENMSSFVVPEGAPDAGVLRVFQPYDPTSVIEIGENGDLLSHLTYNDGAQGPGLGWKMAPTSDGGTLICGKSDDTPTIFKVDHTGAVSWRRKLQLDAGNSGTSLGVKETNDGGIVLITLTYNPWLTRILKLSASGELLWARKMVYAAEGSAPTEIFEDENGQILLVRGGAGSSVECTYRLSATGEPLSANVLCDNGHSYFTDMELMEFRAGEVTGMASVTLNPLCLAYHTGLGWFRAPVEVVWPCCSQALGFTMVDDPVELVDDLPISITPVATVSEITSYASVSAVIYEWDMCIAMDVGSHALTDSGLLLWPDPLPRGEPLHIACPLDADFRDAMLVDAAGRTVAFHARAVGGGRYLMETGSLTPGHYTLSFRTGIGMMAQSFVVME